MVESEANAWGLQIMIKDCRIFSCQRIKATCVHEAETVSGLESEHACG